MSSLVEGENYDLLQALWQRYHMLAVSLICCISILWSFLSGIPTIWLTLESQPSCWNCLQRLTSYRKTTRGWRASKSCYMRNRRDWGYLIWKQKTWRTRDHRLETERGFGGYKVKFLHLKKIRKLRSYFPSHEWKITCILSDRTWIWTWVSNSKSSGFFLLPYNDSYEWLSWLVLSVFRGQNYGQQVKSAKLRLNILTIKKYTQVKWTASKLVFCSSGKGYK